MRDVDPDRYAMVPTLRFELEIERRGGGPVRSIALGVQIRIDATRRAYPERAQERLVEVFGHPEQWGRSLRALPWVNTSLQVPAFVDATVVEMPVTCTYDFEVTAAKYLHALEDGEIPLVVLFSGTVFYAGAGGGLRVAQVPWEKEAEHRLPVSVWREMMERHFGDSAWLRLRRDSFDRLYSFKTSRGLATWEDAVDALVRESEAER